MRRLSNISRLSRGRRGPSLQFHPCGREREAFPLPPQTSPLEWPGCACRLPCLLAPPLRLETAGEGKSIAGPPFSIVWAEDFRTIFFRKGCYVFKKVHVDRQIPKQIESVDLREQGEEKGKEKWALMEYCAEAGRPSVPWCGPGGCQACRIAAREKDEMLPHNQYNTCPQEARVPETVYHHHQAHGQTEESISA